MPVERAASGTSLVDVLDRVLDKGIVIDAWVRVSLVGIDLITVEARVVVASIDTYLKYAEVVGPGPAGVRGHCWCRRPWRSRPRRRQSSACRPKWRVAGFAREPEPRGDSVANHRMPITADAKLALTEFLLG